MATLSMSRIKELAGRPIYRQVSISLVGIITAAGLAFAANIIAGRMLGPGEYGRFALMLAVAQIMIIVILPGIDAAVMRYVAKEKDNAERKNEYIFSGWFLFMVVTAASVLVLLAIRPMVGRYIPDAAGVYGIAIIYALAVTQRNFYEAIARGEHKFRLQAFVKIAEALLVLAILSGLVWTGGCRSYACYAAAGAIGAIVSVVLYWPQTLRGRRMRILKKRVKQVWHYGKFGIVGAVAGVMFTSADRLLIARELGTRELGLYTAYYSSSVMIAVQMGTVLANVLFPVAAGRRDHMGMLKELDKYFVRAALPAVLIIAAGIYIALALFGSAYMFNWKLALWMSFYAVSHVTMIVYLNVTGSAGPKVFRLSAWHVLFASLFYVAALAWLLPVFGIYAPPMGFLLSFGYLAAVRVIVFNNDDLFLKGDGVV